jgi:hypothetical protein
MKTKKLVDPLLPGRYGRMDAAELDEEVAKFDQELIADTARPLSAQDRVRDRKAKRKRGRPKVGNGSRRVLITIEASLLERSDAYADQHGLTRSALIARGLEAMLETSAESSRSKKRQ